MTSCLEEVICYLFNCSSLQLPSRNATGVLLRKMAKFGVSIASDRHPGDPVDGVLP